MHSLSIFGTSSDAGKSTLAFSLTYLFYQRGIRVAPFKAQNVSNNSHVTDEGGEIAIPQYFAAKSINIPTSVDMNPILLKSGPNSKAHIILHGKSSSEKDVREYFEDIDLLKPYVKTSFERLLQSYDCIIAEGAGSPVELNLMDKDLSNIYIAQEFGTKIILVADIEKGGVFASIYGVYKLLPKKLRKNVIGVIINKFKGDIRLFDEGICIIEEEFNIPVLGVVPYRPFNLGFEDSQSLINYTQNTQDAIINVCVINLPHMSNFTDFEPLVADKELALSFITSPHEAHASDVIIIPGSKLVAEDLSWLKQQGFEELLKAKEKTIIGICGGYEMLFENILDPENIESDSIATKGLGLFKGNVTFEREKIVKKGTYNLFDTIAHGYEIHNARAKKAAKSKKGIYGTFIHGLFDNDALRYRIFHRINENYIGFNFQQYKDNSIKKFTQHIDEHVSVDTIIKSLEDKN